MPTDASGERAFSHFIFLHLRNGRLQKLDLDDGGRRLRHDAITYLPHCTSSRTVNSIIHRHRTEQRSHSFLLFKLNIYQKKRWHLRRYRGTCINPVIQTCKNLWHNVFVSLYPLQGHLTFVTSQHRTFFKSPFWRLDFLCGPSNFENFMCPCNSMSLL